MRTFHSVKRIPDIEIVMSGQSTPEDADEFYIPFCDSLEQFVKNDFNFSFSFQLDYYNTSSTRYITRILTILKPGVLNKSIIINWYYLGSYDDYRNYDEDLRDLGEEFAETMNIEMNILKRRLN